MQSKWLLLSIIHYQTLHLSNFVTKNMNMQQSKQKYLPNLFATRRIRHRLIFLNELQPVSIQCLTTTWSLNNIDLTKFA